MKIKPKVWGVLIVIVAIVLVSSWYFSKHVIAVLDPAGQIANKERNLFIFTVLLGLVVVIPVYLMAILIATKYRETNLKAKYSPDFAGHRAIEFAWWAIPTIIIVVLGVITWRSSYALSPYKALGSSNSEIDIEVVALDWKWLFIYPQQNIASVNYFQFPVNTPLHFYVTSDSVMNSFWVPRLGSQIYAMPGMSTQLHLMASRSGDFAGMSANISGQGFAGMTFTAAASSRSSYEAWLNKARASHLSLTMAAYSQLAKASLNNPVSYYSSADPNLYQTIVNNYMMPTSPGPILNPSIQTNSNMRMGY